MFCHLTKVIRYKANFWIQCNENQIFSFFVPSTPVSPLKTNKKNNPKTNKKYINIIDNMSLITEKVLHFTETLG